MTQKQLTQSEWDVISGASLIIGAALLIAAGFLIGGCGSTWQGMKADVHRWTAPPANEWSDSFLVTDGEEPPKRKPRGPSPWL